MIPIRHDPDGLLLPVRVQPGCSRRRIEGEHAGRLKVALNAPPEQGKANKALLRLIAKLLGISRTSVVLVSGQTSRDKLLLVRGISPTTLAKALDRAGVKVVEEQG